MNFYTFQVYKCYNTFLNIFLATPRTTKAIDAMPKSPQNMFLWGGALFESRKRSPTGTNQNYLNEIFKISLRWDSHFTSRPKFQDFYSSANSYIRGHQRPITRQLCSLYNTLKGRIRELQWKYNKWAGSTFEPIYLILNWLCKNFCYSSYHVLPSIRNFT